MAKATPKTPAKADKKPAAPPARGSRASSAKAEAEEPVKSAVPAKRVASAPPAKAGARDASLPAHLRDQMVADAGQGVSSDQADNLVPLIYVLQPLSPQALKRNPKYMEGAEAGMIWLRNASDPLVNGEEGIDFQPCFFYKDIVEWVPRDDGGGFVGRHKTMPKDAVQEPDPQDENILRWKRPNGNQLVETRYHVGYVLRNGSSLPFVIPLASTGHTFSKAWMFMMNSQQVGGAIPPSYACVYRLITEFKQNKKGEWFGWKVDDGEPPRWATEEEYAKGKALHVAFARGEKDIEQPEEVSTLNAGSGAGAGEAPSM